VSGAGVLEILGRLTSVAVGRLHQLQQRRIQLWGERLPERPSMAEIAIGVGWDSSAANDNVAWPSAKALLAEENSELLKVAISPLLNWTAERLSYANRYSYVARSPQRRGICDLNDLCSRLRVVRALQQSVRTKAPPPKLRTACPP
jgi:hypothetical protein